MDFSKEKYEYMIHTWGSFYNEEFFEIHRKEEGYHFFDTSEDRQKYIDELRKINRQIEEGTGNSESLLIVSKDGQGLRYKTIAKMNFNYKGKSYPYEHDFGYGFEEGSARFMFDDGNYNCDCNRSLFLNRIVGDEIPELDCGQEITIADFKIEFIK